MIPVRSDVRIWLATGCTDMRRGMFGLALQVQQGLKRDPHAGDLYIFRGRRGDLIKVLWHDGVGMSLYAKRLDWGRFVWPAATDGVVAITASQMACLLEAIDWRNPRMTWRPQAAGWRKKLGSLRLSAMLAGMAATLSSDVTTLRAALMDAEAEAARAKAINADLAARVALLELQNEKMRRALYGQRSERGQLLIDQLEFGLEELEASAGEYEALGQRAAAGTTVEAFIRARPSRKPLPAHLPRERVVVPAPTSCACCGSDRLSKLGEDVTETLEVIPRQWKVVQTVRERFACRACEAVMQPPAPFHATPRGMFGPSFLAMVMFEKFETHQPLNRQRDRYAREGVEISLSTLADQVGACAAALRPLHLLIERHVLAAERLHGDDTTVRVLAKTKADVGRLWTYVRDDRPFAGLAPPAALFRYSRTRRAEHPVAHLTGYGGILQADAYAGYNALFRFDRSPAPLTRALCWAHARRKFFELADVAAQLKRRKGAAVISPIAAEAVRRIDRVFDVERGINGTAIAERLAVRREIAAPLVTDLEQRLRTQRAVLARHNPVAGAIDYILKDWTAFTRFLDDGRICLTNNAAERALRGVALGRKAWLFAGSDRGGERAASMYTLIGTAKLNDIDPQAWLADVLARIADIPQSQLHELLPWNWQRPAEMLKAA